MCVLMAFKCLPHWDELIIRGNIVMLHIPTINCRHKEVSAFLRRSILLFLNAIRLFVNFIPWEHFSECIFNGKLIHRYDYA